MQKSERRNIAGIGSLVFPILVRSIPEFLAGQYPIGYDTINSYVPLMLDWKIGLVNTTDLAGGWLLPVILGVIQLANVDPVLVIRVAGPIVYGFLGWSLFYFSRNRLSWSNNKSLVLVILSTLYFTSLRLSWDLPRNVLALGFGLVALALSEKVAKRSTTITFSAMVLLAVVSQVLVGAVILAIVGFEILLRDCDRMRKILAVTPATIQFIISTAILALGNFEGVGATGTLGTTRADTLYDFLPILIPCILGLSVLRKPALGLWIILCGFAAGLALFPGPQRWALMMTIPLTIGATEGLSFLFTRMFRHIRLVRAFGALILFVWLALGVTYLALPAQNTFPYFSHFTPTSMVQSSIPSSDSASLVESLRWLSNHIPSDAVLMTHNSMYGWARVYFRSDNLIVNYGPSLNLNQAFQRTTAAGYAHIYTIWWVNGLGWYGNPYPPNGFHLVQQFGNLGVFDYES